MALADTARLVVDLNLNDRLSGPMGRVNRSLSALDRGVGQATRGAGQLAAGIGRVGVIGATVAAGGFVAVARAAGQFEAQLNTINTIVKLNDTQLRILGEGIRETFRETGQPLEDLTAAYYDLLSAGIKVADAQSVLNTAVKLGIGGLATTAEAVDLLTTAINAYGLNASGAAAASDIFAAAVRDGKVKVSEINASFADVAPIAATVGVHLEEIGAAYAVLTARGVNAAEVGTQFNRAIVELLKPTGSLVDVMKGLGLETFETSIRQKGLVATLEDVRVEAERQGIPFQDLFGRIEAYKFALATTGPNQAAFNLGLKRMGDASGETAAQFAERQQGLNFQLGRLKALAQDAGITIGNALLPKLVPLISQLNDFIQRSQSKIAEFGDRLAEGFSNFANSLKGADFSGAIQTLKILGEVGKKVVDIFLSLPSGVQAAIVAGAAVNRLSGGLIGAGVGNIAGGLIKLVFERGSSPANPLWVAQVGGVGGTGGGVAGAAGGGIIRSLLGVTTAVGLGAILGNAIGKTLFFNPTIKPAVDFETAGVERIASSGSLGALNKGIDALKDGLDDLENVDKQIFSVAGQQVQLGFIANLLTGEQTALLQDQIGTLEAARSEIVSATRNSSSSANNWSARQLAAFVQVASEQRRTTAAAHGLGSRLGEVRGALGRGFSELGGIVRAKRLSATVNATIINNVQVNANRVVSQVTRARVATGTIPEFA